MIRIDAVDEYNQGGHLIHSRNRIGAYVRGKTREEALQKFPSEIAQYYRWLGMAIPKEEIAVSIVQEKYSSLQVCDADSDVLFDTETPPLTRGDYQNLYGLALKSARDFETLYRSVPDKKQSATRPRKTFYGMIPTTADEMYNHTKNVTDYYFGEIHLSAGNDPDIYTCRLRAFEELEKQPGFLDNTVYDGSYGEQWSLRKVCRRFIWHDRIHAKAMYRVAVRLFGEENVSNPFCFSL